MKYEIETAAGKLIFEGEVSASARAEVWHICDDAAQRIARCQKPAAMPECTHGLPLDSTCPECSEEKYHALD